MNKVWLSKSLQTSIFLYCPYIQSWYINKIYEFGGYNFRGSDVSPLAQNCLSDGINILCRHPVDPVSWCLCRSQLQTLRTMIFVRLKIWFPVWSIFNLAFSAPYSSKTNNFQTQYYSSIAQHDPLSRNLHNMVHINTGNHCHSTWVSIKSRHKNKPIFPIWIGGISSWLLFDPIANWQKEKICISLKAFGRFLEAPS